MDPPGDQEDAGGDGVIQYQVKLDMDDDLTQFWSEYTSESRDQYFWLFLESFIGKWESKVIPSWELLVTSRLTGGKEIGPDVRKLPEELLAALSKFLFIGKDETEQSNINKKTMEEIRSIVKCLTIICLNTENIPCVASMDFVSLITQLNALLLQHLLEMESTFFSAKVHTEVSQQNLRTSIVDCIVESCHFLETLYDPEFRWRSYLCGKDLCKSRQPEDSPVSLHPETIPFLYESFETALVECFPDMAFELLTVFGGIISGARHNAIKAISPATTKMILKTVRDARTSQEIHINAIYCSSKSIRILYEIPMEERQIDLTLLVDQYQQILLSLTAKPEASLATLVEGISLLSRTLEIDNSNQLQELFARRGLLSSLIGVVGESCLPLHQKKTLLPVIINRISLILQNCVYAQTLMEKDDLYAVLFQVIDSCGAPDYKTLHAVLAMSVYGSEPGGGDTLVKIHNIQPIKQLLNWLTLTQYENYEQQVWLTESLYNLCMASIQNKTLCCENNLIKCLVQTLHSHERLEKSSAEYLLKLIEALGQHSLTAEELKSLIEFLRETNKDGGGEDETPFPYKSHVIHIISSIAKGDGFLQSRQFFDLQDATSGLSVPSISEWSGPVAGFSFHVWIRLDMLELKDENPFRRQLYSFYTNSGLGFEAFFLPDGVLSVGTAHKKEFLVTKCEDCPLSDGRWHAVTVTQLPPKRPFGHSSLAIYVDGTIRAQSQLKYPSLTEPFSYCQIGSPLVKVSSPSSAVGLDGTPALGTGQSSRSTLIKENIKDAIKSSGVFALPQYLKSSHNDPQVNWTLVGMEDMVWGKSLPLMGQIGLLYTFQDSITPAQVKFLFNLGPNLTLASHLGQNGEASELLSKLVFCYSPRVCHNSVCTNLAAIAGQLSSGVAASSNGGSASSGSSSYNLFDGHIVTKPHLSYDAKDVINSLGGIQVLFPILETSLPESNPSDAPFFSTSQDPSRTGSLESDSDWELLPSSSFSDWKLEKNPVSGFLTLIKNLISNHQVNQERLMRGGGVAIIGSLLQKVQARLIDVNVLMASQLFVEVAMSTKQAKLLYQFYHSILLDFRIWSRSEFHMQIGHIQYISTLIMADRKYFRKKFGVQFFLDVVRQHYIHPSMSNLSASDASTIRGALFGLIKFFIQKDVNAREVLGLVNFMYANRKTPALGELLDMLLLYMESKMAREQMFLLLLEPRIADLIYCVLLEPIEEESRIKLLRLLLILMRTPRVSHRHKTRLYLHDAGFLGFIYLRCQKEPPMNLEEVTLLTDLLLLIETKYNYQGLLSLCHHLYLADIDIKLEISRKLLTLIYSHPQAALHLAGECGWEGCIARLLVKEMVKPELDGVVSVEDVISLGDEDAVDGHQAEKEDLPSPSHYINIVADTAKHYLPPQAGHAVHRVGSAAGEATKVLSDTTKLMRSNILSATDRVSSTLQKSHNIMSDKVNQTVKTANTILETVGDLTKRKRLSVTSVGSENPQFSQNYTYEFADNESQLSVSSEDVSKSRETMCSSPTRTHDSVSEDDMSFDMEHFSSELENLKQATNVDNQSEGSKEEELIQNVTNILFTVLWRGSLIKHRKDLAEKMIQSYGQIIASINMLALNNKLYTSHLTVKRSLSELCLQALLSDVKERNQRSAEHGQLARQLMEVVYDLIVLDQHHDFSRKASEPLLDGVLGILDSFAVFHEGHADKEWEEMAKMAFDILLICADNTKDLDFCAIATAKLHSLVQNRTESSQEEAGFLIYRLNKMIETSLSRECTDHYAFLIPIMKALLDKTKEPLHLIKELPALNLRLSGCEFFTEFQTYSTQEEWNYFISRKVKHLHDQYSLGFLSGLSDQSNEFWGNSYEEAKVALHRRNRLIGDSKLAFTTQYTEHFRQRLKDESVRYNNVQTQQRSNQAFVDRRWRIVKRLFFGPRGAWNVDNTTGLGDHWMLATNENMLRMRMKLIPNPNFQNHLDASAQRDNVRKPVNQMENVLDINISKEAVISIPKDEDENDLTEEDLKAIAKEQMENNQETDGDSPDPEKFLLSEECELVNLMTVVKGRFELTNTFLYFFDSRPIKVDNEDRYDNRWSVSSIKEVHLRRFNLKKSALEIFLLDQTNFFINFPCLKKRNKVLLKILSLKPPNLIYHGARAPKDVLKSSGFTQKWVNREISNFEYLMLLNTIAGRSYNDLSQYPVFPWILADYTSKDLDLGSTHTFRDLSKPMGVQNPKHVEEIKQKFDNFEDPSGTVAKFHYGTHYSNSALVLHYLVRVEPFTSLHINLQSGRFDVADRQFHSIPQTWTSLFNNINDVKELIPEFFYFPDFLLNHNCFDLGKLQGKKQRVNDVLLPPWASSVDDFIRQHRNALESEYVSAHLHEWIDLIFGFKQKGKPAEEAINIFYYCCYEGAVNLDAIADPSEREALEGMIQNFGQVPCQLLKEPHPQRISYTEYRTRILKQEHKKLDLLRYPSHWRPYCVELSDERNPILFLQHPRNQTKGFLHQGAADALISVSQDGSVGCHSWLPFDRNTSNYFFLDRDQTGGTKLGKRLPGPFSRGIKLKSKLFAVTSDARHIIYGGSWDYSLRVYSLSKSREVGATIRHTDVITSVDIDEGSLYCISGSVDTTAIVWDISACGHASNAEQSTPPRATQVLYGHDGPVTVVALSISLDLAVTGSQDGTVNMHTIKEGQYLRTLRPRCTTPMYSHYTVEMVALSYQGHVVFTGHTPDSHSIHVFSLNGRHLASTNVSHRVTGLVCSGDHVVTGDENGDLRLVDLYSLSVAKSLHLQLPIQTLTTTLSNTHLLVPLRDGKVIVVCLSGIPENLS